MLLLFAAGCGGRSHGTAADDGESRAPLGCLAAADEFLALSAEGDLFAFRVPTLERRLIAPRVCGGAAINSMAVSGEGGVLLGLQDGSFQAMDSELQCSAPVPVLNERLAARDFVSYGMNFVGGDREPEALFLTLNGIYENAESTSNYLATLDPSSKELQILDRIRTGPSPIEIAGTPDRRLYGYQSGNYVTPGSVLEIDEQSGSVIEEVETDAGLGLGSVALAVTDDAVYAFGSKASEAYSRVVRVDRTSRIVKALGNMPFVITGAGASSCATRAEVPLSPPPAPPTVEGPGPEPR